MRTMEARNAIICSRYRAGATQRQIGQEFGISAPMVFKILRAHGVQNELKKKVHVAPEPAFSADQEIGGLTGRQMNEMQLLWSRGVPLRTIAERLGLSIGVVSRRTQADRKVFPARRPGKKEASAVTGGHPIIEKIVRAAHERGFTAADLCDRAGIDRVTFLGWRRGANPNIFLLAYAAEAVGLQLSVQPMAEAA